MSDPSGLPPSTPASPPVAPAPPDPPGPDVAVMVEPEVEHGSRAPKQPFSDPHPDRADDPQAAIDTREHALAELQEAARREHASRRPEVEPPAAPDDATGPGDVDLRTAGDVHVDLVGAEQEEASELHAAEADDPAAAGAPVVAPGAIDPRIHERRVAVTREEGRRRLRILLVAISVASAVGIVWLIVQSPFLAVDDIHVQGTSSGQAAQVEQQAGVRKGSALLFVDTGAVAHRVEALPWVAKAKVDRELPNGLKITVTERQPAAWARRPVPRGAPKGTVGAVAVIDRFGRVLSDVPAPPILTPELVGIGPLPKRGGRIDPVRAASVLADLPVALRGQTRVLERRDGEWVLQLYALPGSPKGLPAAKEVRLGSLEEMGPKGVAVLAVLDQLVADGDQVRYVDVRVPGVPATR